MSLIALIALLHLNAATPAQPPVTGDYVEARTASVFAGPCHYNSEYVSTGRDVVMAWSIQHGSWNNVDLSNVRMAAAVSSDQNLAETATSHHCELQIDSAATDAQAAAAVAWLNARCHDSIGKVEKVRRAPVTFTAAAEKSSFKADGFASAEVQSMPDHECCKQPNMVWYSPMVPLTHQLVGYTTEAAYSAGTLGDKWKRSGENSAFFGTFAF